MSFQLLYQIMEAVSMETITFTVNHYASLDAASHIGSKELSFKQLVEYLDKNDVHTNKYHNGLFTIGAIKDGYRNNDNIINKGALCIDYDDLDNGIDFIERVRRLKFSYILYSTFNSSEDNYRLRLIIPLSRPIEPKYYKPAIQCIDDGLGATCDDKSFTLSQSMAIQVLKSSDSHRVFEYNDTYILNTDSFMPSILEKYQSTNKSSITSQYSKRDDSYWSSIAYGHLSEGGRNNALASLVGHLICKNVNINVIVGLLSTWNDTLEPAMSVVEFEKTIKSIVKKELNKKGVRSYQ